MKTVTLVLLAALSLSTLCISDAEAKRLGGGGSFGMSRNSAPIQRQASTPPKPAAPLAPAATPSSAPPSAPAPAGMSRWLGPLAGIAAGLGIAALFSHFGMGEGMGNMLTLLLLVMAAMFLFRLFFRRPQAAAADGYAGSARNEPLGAAPGTADALAAVPADFDSAGFLRQAKLNFVRLQAANDKGDMEDLKQFTSPELFAEIRLQYDERGKTAQQTDVIELEANLVEVSSERGQHVASVRFFGQLREEAQAPATAFDEIWHLVKPEDGSRGWSVAGIQQVN